MLYDLEWLKTGEVFPPASEKERIMRYASNLKVFSGDMWGLEDEYQPYLNRIQKVISNFGAFFQFPILLNYQKLITLKMADLVCGEHPTINGSDMNQGSVLQELRDDTAFDGKLYATAIDASRYGDAIWRVYKTKENKNTFCVWSPNMWFPIVAGDGTLDIIHQVLCWITETHLHAQIHDAGSYDYRIFEMDVNKGIIGPQVFSGRVPTGLKYNAVLAIRPYMLSDTIYGEDDYFIVDSILAELMVRVSQVSSVLDKHADPSMTGPVSMLTEDPTTGKMYLKPGQFYGVSVGEDQPKYLTWDGNLESSFKQMEFLCNQLYVLSELGAAILGTADAGSQAISGTAMRFKMVAPLAKARRLTNSLTLPVRHLLSMVSQIGYTPIDRANISIEWNDGLPDDPKENAEIAKILTGVNSMMPLELAIIEYFGRTNDEAKRWLDLLSKQQDEENKREMAKEKESRELGLKHFK